MTTKSNQVLRCLLSVFLALAISAVGEEKANRPVRFDSATISGLAARNIGSAAMSGRIAAVTATDQNGRLTVYAGAASGGIWKSLDGGGSFRPVFDEENVQSIGALAIDPSHPSIVWAGTGESWVRNSVSIGDGVYRSTDGGEHWTNMGLKNSEHIAKILVDPKDGDTVYACAVGGVWSDSEDRGVYKTTDGGKSWRKVLAGQNPSTGCAMLATNVSQPDVIYAAMWDFRRQAWTFRSGGPGSGLFKSTDRGEHWTEITPDSAKGMPEKPYGRIAVAVTPSKPETVYAMIESKKSALFRSDDGGKNWTKLDASQYMVWRPFYFANLIVDPKDENKIFKVDLSLLLSTDGGKSFSPMNGGHGDFHDVWIDPSNSNVIFTGDDGGLWRSLDGGNAWEHMANLPVSQFYHVSVDDADPYHVYGGLQDNGSWVGDSSYPGGVTNSRWESMFFGDGFWMWPDPSDSNYIYAESQGGELGRVNRWSHEIRSIKPYPEYGVKKMRCNWNTPIQISPTARNTLYYGCQFLFRSRDHGQSWERISPDLSTNDPEKQKQEESGGVTVDNSAAEMNNTVYGISESPKNPDLVWVGTDDGNLQLTRDGGKHWTNLISHVKGVPPAPIVSRVEGSRFDEATVYVTLDRHMYGDMQPYLFKSIDYGETWQRISLDDVRGYAHVIKEDVRDPNLLFLGTEFGLYISIDGGAHWAQYKGSNFPAVGVRDLVVEPRTSDLVLATHGRGIWIIDDISSLRALTPDLMAQEAAFLPTVPVIQYIQAFSGAAEGSNSFHGPERPGFAMIPYYQRSRHIFGDFAIQVFDSDGNLVDTLAPSKHRGLNRVQWAMRLKPPRVPPAASAMFGAAQGARVVPGTYTVKMTKGTQVYTTQIRVVSDPRSSYSLEDRRAQFNLVTRLGALLNHMTWAVDAIVGVRDGANERAEHLDANSNLKKQLMQLATDADGLRTKIVATKEGGMITGEERLREYLGALYGDVNSYDGAPTASQMARADVLDRQLADVIKEFQDLSKDRLAVINPELGKKRLAPMTVLPESEWQKTTSATKSVSAANFERD
jgi:photosystem II stability/assembly factor-like uncharacterized protein